jgi:hypothetical protein
VDRKCQGRKSNGDSCGNYAVRGATVCRKHGAAAPQVAAKAAVRAEVLKWGLGDTHVDPGEVLLRLVSQSSIRAEALAIELQSAVEENGGSLAAALIGDSYVMTADGKSVKVGEYIRGLAAYESQERDRLCTFATKALAAGLATRQVELAERTGQLIAELLRSVLGDPALGLTAEQRAAIPAVMRTHLAIAQ